MASDFRGGEIDSAVTDSTVPTVIVGKQLLWSVASILQIWANLGDGVGSGESHIRQAVGRG